MTVARFFPTSHLGRLLLQSQWRPAFLKSGAPFT